MIIPNNSNMIQKIFAELDNILFSPGHHLLNVQDILKIFHHEYFSNKFILLLICGLTTGKKNIIPSLCIFKDKNKDPKEINNIKEVYKHLNINNADGIRKDLSELFKLINKKAYEYREGDDAALIFKKGENIPNEVEKKIFYLTSKVKYQSLNVSNDIYDISIQDIEKLENTLKSSVDESIPIICKYVEKKYNYDTVYLEYNQALDLWEIPSDSSCSYPNPYLEIINKEKSKITYNKPIAGYDKDLHYIIFPFTNNRGTRDLKYTIFLCSTNRIIRDVPINVRRIRDYYFGIFLEKKKNELLADLQAETNSLCNPSTSMFGNDVINLDYSSVFKKFVKKAFYHLLNVTNAFSVTLRLYVPYEKGLIRFVEETHPKVEKNISDKRSKIIPLKDNKSVNVLTYIRKTDDPYYISNMEKHPHNNKKKLGSIAYSEHRANTKSEICYPIYFKKVKIGVMNLESPKLNGFIDDIEFIYNIKKAIEHYAILLFELNDKKWLTRRSQIYQNLHEMENIANQKGFPSEFKDDINDCIRKMNIGVSEKLEPLNELKEFLSKYISDYKHTIYKEAGKGKITDKTINEFEKGCKLFLSKPHYSVSEYKLDQIKIIYKNLLDNYRRYCLKDRDSIMLSQSQKNPNWLSFKVKSSKMYPEEFVNKYLVSPFETGFGEDTETHYGLFVVGMLTRSLSGYYYLKNIKQTNRSELLIKIPIG